MDSSGGDLSDSDEEFSNYLLSSDDSNNQDDIVVPPVESHPQLPISGYDVPQPVVPCNQFQPIGNDNQFNGHEMSPPSHPVCCIPRISSIELNNAWKPPLDQNIIDDVESLDIFITEATPKFRELRRIDGNLKEYLVYFINLPQDIRVPTKTGVELVVSRIERMRGKTVDHRYFDKLFDTLKRNQAKFLKENKKLFEGLKEFDFDYVEKLPVHSDYCRLWRNFN